MVAFNTCLEGESQQQLGLLGRNVTPCLIPLRNGLPAFSATFLCIKGNTCRVVRCALLEEKYGGSLAPSLVNSAALHALYIQTFSVRRVTCLIL